MDEWLQAAERGDVEAMTAFLTAGLGVNASTSSGETCLMRAAMHGQTGVVELLLTCGAEVDARQANGKTALSLASFFGHTDVVSILLRQGANAQLPDNLGVTAFDWAMSRGQFEIAQQLRQSAANLPLPTPDSAHEAAVLAPVEDEPLELPSVEHEQEVTLVPLPPTEKSDEPLLMLTAQVEQELQPVWPATNGVRADVGPQPVPLVVAPAGQNLIGNRRHNQVGALRARTRINERKKAHRTISTALNSRKHDEDALPRARAAAQTAIAAKQPKAPAGGEPAHSSAIEAKDEAQRHTLNIVLAMFATFCLAGMATWRLLGPHMLSAPAAASNLTQANSQSVSPAARPDTDVRPAVNMPTADAPPVRLAAHDTAANRRDPGDVGVPKKTKQTNKQGESNELARSEDKSGNKRHEHDLYVVSQAGPDNKARTKRAETAPPARHINSSSVVAAATQPITKKKVAANSPTTAPVMLPTPPPKPQKKVIPWP